LSHQINLLDPGFRHLHKPPGSTAGLVALLASLGLAAAIALTLSALGARASDQAGAAELALGTLQAQSAASGALPSGQVSELARLRTVEAGQRRIRAALDPALAGGVQGYSGYLLALSHQSSNTLWLTGFGVAPDGHSLEISGRMTDPRQLPLYLRRLDAEPLFNGREFAQLSLRTVEPGATTGDNVPVAASYVEFALRSTVAAAEAR
jgi:Fimbrial assembly protein (PilN)